MATARYYDEDKNPGGTQHVYGVPQRDISDDEYEALPDYLKAQVDASPMYKKSAPKKKAAAETATQEPAGETEKPAGSAGEG